MLFKLLYDPSLAQASYLVGCQRTGEAAVVDPNRDVELYAAAAAAEGVRITHVTETHIHADFVSGARELAARFGAQLLLSDEGGTEWKYGYAAAAGARLLRDGDTVAVGDVRLDVMHTPGHTPEHLAFLVTDTAATRRPMGVLTGDFVFVGDVGRPDLLEKAVGAGGTMDDAARALFRSLQRFKQLPDYLQLWPGHGAGSACGKALGAVPSSTLGYERLVNWALSTASEDEFVALVLARQPEPPRYFARMKRVNRDGPAILGARPRPMRLPDDELAAVLGDGALVIDTRPPAHFAAGHVPRTVNVPLNKSFTTWVGWLASYDQPLYLVVDGECAECAEDAARRLALIGFDHVAGVFDTTAVRAWGALAGAALDAVPQVDVPAAADLITREAPLLLDVRGETEWAEGRIPGSLNVHVGYVAERLAAVPRDTPILVHCQGGARSAIAASVLRREGFTNVTNMGAGYGGWAHAGRPTESGG